MERYYKIRGKNIYTEVLGEESSPAVLYIHGGPGGIGSSDFVEFAAEKLSQKFRIIAPDQRGVWRSEEIYDGEDIYLEDIIEDFEEIRKILNIEKWSILSHSFGGYLAVLYAHIYPDSIDYMIYENPSFDFSLSERSMLRMAAEELVKKGDVEKADKYFEALNSNSNSISSNNYSGLNNNTDSEKDTGLNNNNINKDIGLNSNNNGNNDNRLNISKVNNMHGNRDSNEDEDYKVINKLLMQCLNELGSDGNNIMWFRRENDVTEKIARSFENWAELWNKSTKTRFKLLKDWRVYHDVFNELGGIKKPSLLIKGKYDPITCEIQIEEFMKKPDRNIVMFDRSGHYVKIEECDKFCGVVTNYLLGQLM